MEANYRTKIALHLKYYLSRVDEENSRRSKVQRIEGNQRVGTGSGLVAEVELGFQTRWLLMMVLLLLLRCFES